MPPRHIASPMIKHWSHAVVDYSASLTLKGRDLMVAAILDGSIELGDAVDDGGSPLADLIFDMLAVAMSRSVATAPSHDDVPSSLVSAVAGIVGPEVVAVTSFAMMMAEKRCVGPLPGKVDTFNSLVEDHVRALCAANDEAVPRFKSTNYRTQMLRKVLAAWCNSDAFGRALTSCALDDRFSATCALDNVNVADDQAVETAVTEVAAATKASFLHGLAQKEAAPMRLKRKARRPLSELSGEEFAALMKRRN